MAKKKTVKKKTINKKLSQSDIEKELNEEFLNFYENELNESKKLLNELKNPNNFDKRKKIEFEGKKYKYKTLYNKILNRAVYSNTSIFKINQELGKKERADKYKGWKAKKDEDFTITFKAWDSKMINDYIFKNPELISVNGLSKKFDLDKINDLLNDFKIKSNSDDSIVLHYGESGKGRIAFISSENVDEVE